MRLYDISVEELIDAISGLSGVALQIHREFKPIFVTDTFARLYGFSSTDEFMAQGSIWPLIPEDMREQAQARYQAAIDTGASDPKLLKSQRPDGEQVWVRVQDRRLMFQGEYCVMTVLIDINDEVRLREQYECAAEQAEQARLELEQLQAQIIEKEKQTALNHLLVGVSHQMNTPLGTIRTSVSDVDVQIQQLKTNLHSKTLRQSQLSEGLDAVQEAVGIINRSVDRAGELIRKVKYMVSGNQDNEQAVCRLSALIRDSVALSLSDAAHPDLHVDLSIDESIKSVANPNVWMQIVSVLCENAVIHGLKQTSPGQIRVSLETDDEGGILKFSDNGQGIPDELRDRIFEPFFSSQMGSYSGLGLALVYSLVTRRLNGEVYLDTPEFGDGTTIAIRLTSPALLLD